MRIGIYTQPLHSNYGGLLQAWALQNVLRRMGHDVVTFQPDMRMRLSWKRALVVYPLRFVRYILGKSDVVRYEHAYNEIQCVTTANTRGFVEGNINYRKYRKISALREKDYDMIIVGSDQVWRPCYNNSFYNSIENSFLDFAQSWNIKRIAYAASFGTDEWEFTEEETKKCAALAKLFDAVSVREMSGIGLCRDKLGVDAVHVLDPTLLLDREDYVSLIEKNGRTIRPKGQLMCYILDETKEKKDLIALIADTKNLIPFRANARIDDATATLSEKVQPPVEQWLRDFLDAEFVVTDSFHACVFSIIFNKPFVVLGNRERGMARFMSLMEMFGLTDHLLYSIDDYQTSRMYSIPGSAYEKLLNMRALSFKYLSAYIN